MPCKVRPKGKGRWISYICRRYILNLLSACRKNFKKIVIVACLHLLCGIRIAEIIDENTFCWCFGQGMVNELLYGAVFGGFRT